MDSPKYNRMNFEKCPVCNSDWNEMSYVRSCVRFGCNTSYMQIPLNFDKIIIQRMIWDNKNLFYNIIWDTLDNSTKIVANDLNPGKNNLKNGMYVNATSSFKMLLPYNISLDRLKIFLLYS